MGSGSFSHLKLGIFNVLLLGFSWRKRMCMHCSIRGGGLIRGISSGILKRSLILHYGMNTWIRNLRHFYRRRFINKGFDLGIVPGLSEAVFHGWHIQWDQDFSSNSCLMTMPSASALPARDTLLVNPGYNIARSAMWWSIQWRRHSSDSTTLLFLTSSWALEGCLVWCGTGWGCQDYRTVRDGGVFTAQSSIPDPLPESGVYWSRLNVLF